jgi:hypothetical protein
LESAQIQKTFKFENSSILKIYSNLKKKEKGKQNRKQNPAKLRKTGLKTQNRLEPVETSSGMFSQNKTKTKNEELISGQPI